jgi:hypothetical protein
LRFSIFYWNYEEKTIQIIEKVSRFLIFYFVILPFISLTPPVVHNARRRCDGGAQRDEEEEEPSHLREGIDG